MLFHPTHDMIYCTLKKQMKRENLQHIKFFLRTFLSAWSVAQ